MKTTKQQFKNEINRLSVDLISAIDSISADDVQKTIDCVSEHDPVLGNMLKKHNDGMFELQRYINTRTE